MVVSIHASVKDATSRRANRFGCNKGFNPRICKRCDHGLSLFGRRRVRFNPRICKRCDDAPNAELTAQLVSIHASVKDATTTAAALDGDTKFQSTHL